MTRRDNITRWRAKDLWTGLSLGASTSASLCGEVLTARSIIGGRRTRLWPRISCYVFIALRRRSWLNSCLKPYWGKPTVRNFRGGGENTGTEVRLPGT